MWKDFIGLHRSTAGLQAYWATLLLFWLLGAGLWIGMGYEGSFLWLNRQRFPLGDLLAPHLTHLGDGLIVFGLLGVLLAPHKGEWIWALLASLLAILLVILLCKNIIFEEWDRPLVVFSDKSDFFYNSLSLLRYHAFPSGHSAAIAGAITLFTFALAPSKAWQGLLLAFLAITVAMTRLYIGVHFLGDVVIGTLLGSLISTGIGLPLGRRLEGISKEKSLLYLRISAAMMAIVALFLGMILVMMRYYGL